MMDFNSLPLSKAQQRKKRGRRKAAPALPDLPESAIQKQLDDMLEGMGIYFIRIPDNFWQWLHRYSNASANMKKELGHYWGGMPDTMAFIKVSDKYMLCCPIECKSKEGRRHGKQKHWESQNIAFQISKSPDESISIVQQFLKDAPCIRHFLNPEPITPDCCPVCGGTGIKQERGKQ